MTFALSTLLQIGGLLHFGLLNATVQTPWVLDWRNDLRSLHPLTRQVIGVHSAFLALLIIGLGLITTFNATALAAGTSSLARSVCAFISIFWLSRLPLQFFLFSPAPLLVGRPVLKVGYHVLTFVFLYLGLTFGWAAVHQM